MTTQVESTFVTRAEFLRELAEINRRIQGLYNLADRLGYTVDVPEAESVPEAQSDHDAPSVVNNSAAPVEGLSSGVDYAAVAYGLTSLKADIVGALGASAELNRRYAQAVDWFASCFAGDASFNGTDFRRAAGV